VAAIPVMEEQALLRAILSNRAKISGALKIGVAIA
jgi:hypothetical protein